MAVRKKFTRLDYRDPDVREEILVRQRRGMWTPEQIASLASHFRLRPGHALLDAGCGFGYSLRTFGPFCTPGGRLTGLDRDAELLEIATRLASEEGLGDVTTFEAGDIRRMPFDDGVFDVVMTQVVLCHLEDPERALDELIRVAKPGGCVAVFDNAVGGCPWGWNSVDTMTVEESVQRCEEDLLAHEGRKALGRGDWSVGLFIPAWMEARGLVDVDARVNERVSWMAPPHRSAGQQDNVQRARDMVAGDGFSEMDFQNLADELRAMDVAEERIEHAVLAARERRARFLEAVRRGDAAYSHGGCFWCIWGFRPR